MTDRILVLSCAIVVVAMLTAILLKDFPDPTPEELRLIQIEQRLDRLEEQVLLF